MNVSTDKLLAIKAFYLGHGIREQAEFKVNALKMIDSAINYLSEKEGLRAIKRLIFYKLIKCELLRFDDNGINCRHEAQELSKQACRLEIYKDYMTMVGSTDSKFHVDGFTNNIAIDESHNIKTAKRELAREPLSYWHTYQHRYNGKKVYENIFWSDTSTGYERPLKALNIAVEELNDKQLQFLNDWSLKDIMIAHNINYH
jgi:hypothetical protein